MKRIGSVTVFGKKLPLYELEERKRPKYSSDVACRFCQHQNTCEVKWYMFKCEQFDFKLEDKKMNYFMLDGKRIPMSDETAKSLRKEQPIEWEFGDTAVNVDGLYRVLLFNTKNGLVWHDKTGVLIAEKNYKLKAKEFGYTKTGNIFKEN